MRNSNHILRGAQTVSEKNFTGRSRHLPWPKKIVTLVLTHHLFAIGNILFYFFLWTVRAVCLTNISVVCVRSMISSRYCRGYNIKAEKLYRQLSTLQNIIERLAHRTRRTGYATVTVNTLLLDVTQCRARACACS